VNESPTLGVAQRSERVPDTRGRTTKCSSSVCSSRAQRHTQPIIYEHPFKSTQHVTTSLACLWLHCRSLLQVYIVCLYIYIYIYIHMNMGWLRSVGSLELHVSFAQEPYTPWNYMSLLQKSCSCVVLCDMKHNDMHSRRAIKTYNGANDIRSTTTCTLDVQ